MGKEDRIVIFSRRSFMKATALSAVGQICSAQGLMSGAGNGRIFAYVGSYTDAVDGGANGEGIYRFDMDPQNGALTQRKLVAKTQNPSWIVIHPSKKYLFTVNEIVHQQNGLVSAYAIEPGTGDLTFLNAVSSEGSGPAHMSLDASGNFAFVANYASGTIAVLPIEKDGRVGAAVDVHHDIGSVGAKSATDAPTGSFAISGHDGPHAHMIATDPGNRFILATDIGQDRIYVYHFDQNSGKLTPLAGENFVTFPSGDGPRHFVFHPNSRWMYVVGEESSTVEFFHYDTSNGRLTLQQSISSLPKQFAGTNFTSELVLSPDGRFLYVANRLHDTIAICSIGNNGRLALVGEVSTMGDYPRHCAFGPNGDFFYVCNQRSDSITSFQVQRETGRLTFTGRYFAVGSPAIVTFLSSLGS